MNSTPRQAGLHLQPSLFVSMAVAKEVFDTLGPPIGTKVIKPEMTVLLVVRRHVDPFGALDALEKVLTLTIGHHPVKSAMYDENRQ